MIILITGFEPFGGGSVNPSWEAVSRLPERIGGAELHRLRLPVVFGQCGALLMREIEAVRPDIVICCGVAGGRKEVTPELVAVNWRMGSIPDNAGAQYSGERIDADGPAAYMTELPVNAMVDAMNAAGYPARLSLSAGAYVCNDLYYAAMQGQARCGYRGLFIHVPSEEDLSVDRIAAALECCLKTAVECAEAQGQ